MSFNLKIPFVYNRTSLSLARLGTTWRSGSGRLRPLVSTSKSLYERASASSARARNGRRYKSDTNGRWILNITLKPFFPCMQSASSASTSTAFRSASLTKRGATQCSHSKSKTLDKILGYSERSESKTRTLGFGYLYSFSRSKFSSKQHSRSRGARGWPLISKQVWDVTCLVIPAPEAERFGFQALGLEVGIIVVLVNQEHLFAVIIHGHAVRWERSASL
jgi:hypothetical protein